MQKKNNYSNYLDHDDHQKGLSHDDENQSNIKHSHHNHLGHLRDTNSRVLKFCLIITFSFSFIEAVGGYITNSVTLQSDALHMLTDAAGLLIAYFANNISKRPATVNLTFGYGKAEALGAMINCVFTIILTLFLLAEVIYRFFNPVEVKGLGLFVVAGIGFVVNSIIAFTLAKNSHSLNIKAALIHTLGDLLASIIAIVAGVLIIFTKIDIIDPILSLIVIIILIVSNYSLIKKSAIVLMAGVPEYLSYEQVGKDLAAIDGVIGVHDLHIWYLTANAAALSAHIVASNPLNWEQILNNCQRMLKNKHQIEHITLQYEFDKNPEIIYCEIK
jgi:cobalt-zinc-cadmium efflux system protein